MRQIFNIFRKDARHLWPQILLTWSLFVAFDVFEILSFPLDLPDKHRINSLSGISMLLLMLAIWYLVALAIYEEPLPGDRQFWLTKPYSRGGLLAEKVLFIAFFINLPLFCSDAFILGLQGFPVLSNVPELLLRQLIVSALLILPSFVIATVTRGVAQFVFAWFLVLLGLIAQSLVAKASYDGGVAFYSFAGWSEGIFLVALALSIIFWQYAKRQTIAGRAILLVLAFVGLSAISVMSSLARQVPGLRPKPEVPSKGPANIHISYDLGSPRRWVSSPSNGYIELYFPVRVELPPDTLLEGSGAATIEVGGKPWPKPGWLPATFIERSMGEYWQRMGLDVSMLDALKNREINIESSLHLTLLTDKIQTSVPVAERSFWVPNLGHCDSYQALAMTTVACRVGPSFIAMTLRYDEGSFERSIVPGFAQPALPWGLSPTRDLQGGSATDLKPNATFDFIPRREILSFDKALSLHNLHLTDQRSASGRADSVQ